MTSIESSKVTNVVSSNITERVGGGIALSSITLDPATGEQTTLIENQELGQRWTRIERDGLVRRERDAKDRRVIYVHLTEAGTGKVEAVLPGHVAALVEEFKVLSVKEQEMLGELCKKLGRGRESA